jgi:RNA polymerase sigma-70 factor (ECF subfamily)
MSEQKVKPSQELANTVAAAFRKYAPELHRYIARRMRNPASAPDLTQEIFERFLQLPSSDTVRNTQRYLYGIASHVVSEFRDREEHSHVAFDSEAVDSAQGRLEHSATDDIADRLALQQDIKSALAKLAPVHRAVLLLVKRDGFTYAEVAQKTGLAESTVTKYVFEARAKVKMLLKREPGEEGFTP